MAYGKGGVNPTTTDACLVTGRLSPLNFDNEVNMEEVKKSIKEKVGDYFNMTVEEAAMSIIRVADSNMFNALKLISVRRGYDPRDFTMVAFGGGGPMHSAYLAKELNMKKLIIPVAASVFAAWGMLMTDVRHDYIQTKICPMNSTKVEELNNLWQELINQVKEQFQKENIKEEDIQYTYIADMRYVGQEHTVKVNVPPIPWSEEDKAEIVSRFHNTHEHFYTFKLLDTPTEIVNLHLVANGCLQKPEFKKINKQEKPIEEMIKEVRPVYFAEKGWLDTKVYDREKLGAGFKVSGPAIIEEVSSSTIVLEKQTLTVDDYGSLIIEMEGK